MPQILQLEARLQDQLITRCSLEKALGHRSSTVCSSNETSTIMAMCNIGGRSINAAMIQGYILGYRTHCSGQWLRTLLYSRLKQKARDEWRAYAIEQPEPLLHFALCSGSHSDPAVNFLTDIYLLL
ncbi:hypothetical protein B296_00004578 [Ensete ventricosum]|uniref:DUF547 domain-containing protein n=1 Tax=Ensete ventricosum TaxID=4639 RepID=A0A427AIL5_ENSVE|nr:hypothetical protein B296_00004578 [Ensete ventricosum]